MTKVEFQFENKNAEQQNEYKSIKIQNDKYHIQAMERLEEIKNYFVKFNADRKKLMEDWNWELKLFQENREAFNEVQKEVHLQGKKLNKADENIKVCYYQNAFKTKGHNQEKSCYKHTN